MDYSFPYGGDPMQSPYGGGMGGYNQGCPATACMGGPYGGGGAYPGAGGFGGGPYGMGGDPYGMGGGQYPTDGNSGCPYAPCPRGGEDNGYNVRASMQSNGGGSRKGSVAISTGGPEGHGSFSENASPYGDVQVPCMECGSLPNPACRINQNGGAGGGAGANTPCQKCGGLTNPACAFPTEPPNGNGNGNGNGAPGMGLTPCQQCGGMKSAPCGMGTVGAATPCVECAGNPNAPCLNMGPCLECPPPPGGYPGGPGGPGGVPDDKELFVLKIGKKKEGTDKKPRMELELITPKAPVVKPIPKHETRDTQYDAKDVPGGKGKDGKGKGKGKKGKKK